MHYLYLMENGSTGRYGYGGLPCMSNILLTMLFEKSYDKVVFHSLDTVHSSPWHFYGYSDTAYWPGDIYYRLNIFDVNGDHHYSGIKKIIPQGLILNIYPNPSAGKFTIQTNTPYTDPATGVVVRNMLGQIVYQGKIQGAIAYIDLNNKVVAGCYAVQILNKSGKIMESKKLIVISHL